MISRDERILITGAKGFLGSHIVTRARGLGIDAVAAHRSSHEEGCVYLDVCSAPTIESALRQAHPSVVIHCAAYGLNYAQQDLWQAIAVNVRGSLALFEAAKLHGIRRLVHVGTCFEYGSYDAPIKEEIALNPTGLYGATKAAATVLMRQRASALDIELLIVRPFSIWGANDASHHLVPQVIAACQNRAPLDLSPCEVLRDYMYVEDVADRILQLALLPSLQHTPMTVNVGSGRAFVLREFVKEIAKELEGEDLMRFGALPYRSSEMKALVADVSRLRSLIGETPITSIPEGVQKILRGAPPA